LSKRSTTTESAVIHRPASPAGADWLVEVRIAAERRRPSLQFHGAHDAGIARNDACEAVFAGVLAEREGLLSDRERSDAEVLAAAYREQGAAVLKDLRGSFALVLVDHRRGQVLCLRDPLGTHPLFYADLGRRILLSPSLERLRSHDDVPRGLNHAALVDHLCHRWPDGGETPFSAIRRVPVAHSLRIEREPELLRYWELPRSEEWIEDDELGTFDELFERAIARQLQLGQVGIYLSGGFDSVSIAAVAGDLATKQADAPPWALSLGFPHPDCDERDVQRSVAATLQMPQILMPFDQAVSPEGLVGSGIRLSAQLPLPLLNAWRPAYVSLAREARGRGCDVILSGAGGDEWLTVNPMYMADLLRRGNVLAATKFGRTLLRSYRRSAPQMVRFLVWNAGVKPLILMSGRRMIRRVKSEAIYAKRRRDLMGLGPPWVAPSGSLQREVRERIDKRAEQRMREPEPSGRYGFYFRGMDSPVTHPDRSREQEEDFEVGRILGLRIHHPYWDPDLISFLSRIPPRLLLAAGREKGLVREATKRRFPGAGFERQRKVSALSFFQQILENEALRNWRDLGGAPALSSLGVVDAEAVEHVVHTGPKGNRLRRLNQLWELMTLEAWVRSRL
jgi:asparagine synthetase B (glutamine-hydrolysing)